MGVSMYDKEKSPRRLEATYELSTPAGVEALYTRWHTFILLPYDRGDYGVVDLMLDAERALLLAGLTLKQRRAFDLVYVQGYTQQEVADMYETTQSGIARLLARATKSIAQVFAEWEGYGLKGEQTS